jgi:uncharacterized protein (DUF58 family)
MDLTVREYREGDDLRRVHWPTTARRGELMVRRDERPEDQRTAVLVDARRQGHGGASSLEWAVVAAASAVVRAALDEHAVVLAGDGRTAAGDDAEEALDRLAVLEAGADGLLADGVAHLEAASPTAVAAVLGDLGPAHAAAVADAARPARRIALLLHVPDFGGSVDPGWEARHEGVKRTLAGSGWSVSCVRPGDRVDDVWTAAVTRGAR